MIPDLPDDHGRGWRRLSNEDLADLLYLGLKLTDRGVRRDLIDRNCVKSDDAARSIAGQLATRMRSYPVFGPAKPAEGPSIGAKGINPSRQPA